MKESNRGFVAVCRPKDTMQAGMIREALEQAGVTCYVDNENAAAVRSIMGIGVATTTVMVARADVDSAKQIIENLHME